MISVIILNKFRRRILSDFASTFVDMFQNTSSRQPRNPTNHFPKTLAWRNAHKRLNNILIFILFLTIPNDFHECSTNYFSHMFIFFEFWGRRHEAVAFSQRQQDEAKRVHECMQHWYLGSFYRVVLLFASRLLFEHFTYS